MRAQNDIAWKSFIEKFLRDVLLLCFPAVAAAIDWSIPPRFLDNELKKLLPRSRHGSRYVDKLIEVKLLTGKRQRVLLHFEIQHLPNDDFAPRLEICRARLRDQSGRPVVTLAILADENPDWRPRHYEEEILGCSLRFEFLTCKLLDLVNERREELEQSDSPAAVMVLANWAAQKTRKNMDKRLAAKVELIKRLYEKNYDPEQVLELVRFIDWMMELPKNKDAEFLEEMESFAEEKGLTVEYLANFEVRAMAKGRKEGREEGREEGIEEGIERGLEQGLEQGRLQALQEDVLEILHVRFGPVPKNVSQKIGQEKNKTRLKALFRKAVRCASVEKLF